MNNTGADKRDRNQPVAEYVATTVVRIAKDESDASVFTSCSYIPSGRVRLEKFRDSDEKQECGNAVPKNNYEEQRDGSPAAAGN